MTITEKRIIQKRIADYLCLEKDYRAKAIFSEDDSAAVKMYLELAEDYHLSAMVVEGLYTDLLICKQANK